MTDIDYRQSESRILWWQQDARRCPRLFAYGSATGRLSRDWQPHTIIWPKVPGEGRKHSYDMRKAMKHQGMTLERALELQLEHMRERGETLEGYLAYFAERNAHKHVSDVGRAAWVQRTWEADTEWLNTLVRAALLKNTGHSPGDVDTILKNRKFFEQVRTKGVTR